MLALALTGLSGAATARWAEPVVPCFVTPAQDTAVDLRTDCGYVVVSQDRSGGSLIQPEVFA